MSIAEQIRAVEELRTSALVAGDLDAFAAMCDDRLIYTHSVGRRDDKDSLLKALRSGAFRYNSIQHVIHDMQELGDAVCASGTMHAEIEADGRVLLMDTLTTSVWVRSGTKWRVLAFHTTARA